MSPRCTAKVTLTLLLAGLIGGPALAADDPRLSQINDYPGMTEHSRMISEGELQITAPPNMHHEKGRFHIIHVDEFDMECTSCHVEEGFAPDYQLVVREQALAKAAGIGKGDQADVIDRTVCLGCHKAGAIASRWYGTVGR